MEAKVKGKTFETITKLMELQPDNATLITLSYDDNKKENVSEKEIDIGLIQGEISILSFKKCIYCTVHIIFYFAKFI
jgi:hypothetical protein